MEKLALCSSILYNNDLLEKKKEIEKLKSMVIEKPPFIFQNEKKFKKYKNNLFDRLEERIFDIIVEDNFLYDDIENIKYYTVDICFGQRYKIYNLLYYELNMITMEKYQKWCENIAWEIIFALDSGLQTLKKLDKIDNFTEEEMASYIFENIFWQLEYYLIIICKF